MLAAHHSSANTMVLYFTILFSIVVVFLACHNLLALYAGQEDLEKTPSA